MSEKPTLKEAPPSYEELKEQIERLSKETEIRMEEAQEVFKKRYTGTLIYGPPVDRKQKESVKYVEELLKRDFGETVKRMIFERECPIDWIFFCDSKGEWFKFNMVKFKGYV